MHVSDKPGVLAGVAAEFAKHDVSISTVQQTQADDGARLVVITHTALESALASTVEALANLENVVAIRSVLRLEGTEV